MFYIVKVVRREPNTTREVIGFLWTKMTAKGLTMIQKGALDVEFRGKRMVRQTVDPNGYF